MPWLQASSVAGNGGWPTTPCTGCLAPSWGIPYGIVARRTDVPPEISGPVFGLAVWGAALAHQPALGIADVPWKRSLQPLGSEGLFHLVYGFGAPAAVRALGR